MPSNNKASTSGSTEITNDAEDTIQTPIDYTAVHAVLGNDDLLKLPFSFLTRTELSTTSLVSKQWAKNSQELLQNKIAKFKEGDTLFAVGKMIQTSEPSGLFDKGNPYPKARKSIPEKEIMDAKPTGKVMLFSTLEEAQKYAQSKVQYREGADDSYAPAIFRISVTGPKTAAIKTEEITPNSPFHLPSINKEKTPIPCFKTNLENLVIEDGRVYGYGDKQLAKSNVQENKQVDKKECRIQ